MRGSATALVLAAVLAGGAAAGAWASGAPADPDFLRLHDAGALVASGGAARLYAGAPPAAGPESREGGGRPWRAPPAVAVAAAPLGKLPERTAWVLWEAICGASAAAGIALAASAAARAGGSLPAAAAAAATPLAPLLLDAVAKGNLAAPLLLLLAGSLAALGAGRARTAGILAGAAAAVKVVPVLLVLWFAWKGAWRAAAFGLGAALALSVALPFAAAPSCGAGLLGGWASQDDLLVTEMNEHPGTSATPSAVSVDGQSLRSVLWRVLGRSPYYRLREKPLVRDVAGDRGMLVVHPADPLGPRTVLGLWLGASFLLFSVAVLATGPAGGGPGAARARLPLEGGLVLAALPLFWPEARAIHYLLLAPLLAALPCALASLPRRADGRFPAPILAAVAAAGALLILLPADPLVGEDFADALLARGATAWGGILLFGVSALTLFRLRAVPPGTEPAPLSDPVP